MRKLAVLYCPKCEYYAYYQTSHHPQCPGCGTQEVMHMVRIHYSEFMRISCDERNEFLSEEILKTSPSPITQLTEPYKRYNSREAIAETNNVIMNPNIEDKILSDTVKWMYDTIWGLMYEKREYGQSSRMVPGDCGDYRDFRDCGNCRDWKPPGEYMEVTVHTEQTEATYSEAAAVGMSQAEGAEKGYKRQLATVLGNPNLKIKSEEHINFQLYISFMQVVRYNNTHKKCFVHIFIFRVGKEWNYES